MRKMLPRCAIAIGLGLCVVGPGKAGDLDLKAIDSIFSKYTASTPGCALAIKRGGETTIRTYGLAVLEDRVPITAETVFEAGSISKQFTAASILRLAEEKKLSLDDDIRKYLPELPQYKRKISINNLLDHTNGLREWNGLEAMAGHPPDTALLTNADILRMQARQRDLNHLPGEAMSYTNSGYVMLAIIVQRVSGQSLPAFTRDQFFKPMGMNATQWRDDYRKIVSHRAVGYDKVKSGFRRNMPFSEDYGSGGLLTTVGDLLIWNDALREGKLGAFIAREQSVRGQLNDGTILHYGRGLIHSRDDRGVEVYHPGGRAGFRGFLARYDEPDTSVAALCNMSDAAEILMTLDHYINPFKQGEVIDPAERTLDIPGLFVSTGDSYIIQIDKQNRGLVLAGVGKIAVVSPHKYRYGDSLLSFLPNGGVRIDDQFGGVRLFSRVTPTDPELIDFSSYVGKFHSDEVSADYDVSVRSNHLALAINDLPAEDLMPRYADVFSAPNGWTVRFERNSDGEISAMHLSSPRVWDLRAPKDVRSQ